MLSNKQKAQLIIMATFVLGVIAGASGHYLFSSRQAAPQAASAELLLEELTREVGLNETQRAEAEKILDQAWDQYEDMRRQVRPQFAAIRESASGRVRAILDPEQQKRFDRWNREQEAKRDQKK